jgi:hypothetical protein
MNYLIEYNNKIIGVYNTFNDAELCVLGNLQNNLFIDNVKILTFHSNSCYCTEVKNYYDYDIDKNNDIDDIEKKNELKSKLQHDINILNYKKKKLDEKKNIYENDLNLFNLFKNENKDIPLLFKKKYEIMNNLYNDNNLNIDTYFNVLENNIYEEFSLN